LILARLNPDGSIDSSFGAGGVSQWDVTPFDVLEDLAVQADGKILAVGTIYRDPMLPVGQFFIQRYNPDGSPDSAFGSPLLLVDRSRRGTRRSCLEPRDNLPAS